MTGQAGRAGTGAKVVLGGATAAVVLMVSVAAVVSDPGAPRADAADGLERFSSCRALESWYADHAERRVWPQGGITTMQEDGTVSGAESSRAAGPADAVGGSATGTNTQEADVDEPDVAKTDGRILAQVSGGRVVVSDVGGPTPRRLVAYDLPGDDAQDDGAELLLVGDRLVVLLPGAATSFAGPVEDRSFSSSTIAMPYAGSTRVLVLDLSDPTSPRTTSDLTYSGNRLSVRQHGDVVRLVSHVVPPTPRTIGPRSEEGGVTPPRPPNPQDVRLRARDWLPTVRESGAPASAARPLVRCDEVLHQSRGAVTGTVAVTGFDPSAPDVGSTTAVAASGDTVYSSASRMYVASTEASESLLRRFGSRLTGRSVEPRESTAVHELDLDGLGATYAASGRVAGSLRDRWSMDEHDGVLRLALRTGATWATDDGARRAGANAVVTMERAGRDLVVRGRVDGLGRGEEIKSVRWFDDLAVVVTFRQMDPLHTVDLSDPRSPRLTGELKVPGFSGYLHPIGRDRILGLGTEATSAGVSEGAQASVFDLSDLARPVQVDRHLFGRDSWLPAADDPRTFTWLPGADVGYAVLNPPYDPATEGDGRGIDAVVARIAVDDDGTLSVSELSVPRSSMGDAVRVLPLPDGRVAVVSGAGVRVATA